MTADLVSSVAGVALSLVMFYVPGVSAWYDALEPTVKRLVMLVLLAASAVGIALYNQFDLVAQWQELARVFIAALLANQATFLAAPRPRKQQ